MNNIVIQTEIEKKLGIAVMNPAYPPGHVKRYGAVGDEKAIDDAQAVNRAMTPVLTKEEALQAAIVRGTATGLGSAGLDPMTELVYYGKQLLAGTFTTRGVDPIDIAAMGKSPEECFAYYTKRINDCGIPRGAEALMTNLVARLRKLAEIETPRLDSEVMEAWHLLSEAADEIERLSAALEPSGNRLTYVEGRLVRAEAELLSLGCKVLDRDYWKQFPDPYIPGSPLNRTAE
jgi:hypothetical protein